MRRFHWSISHLFALTALIAASLPAFLRIAPAFQGSNCGGNSIALWSVKRYGLLVELANERPSEAVLSVATATAWQRTELDYIAYDVPDARFLVSSESFRDQRSGPRRVIIVCDQAFTNVPRDVVGTAPPTHAALFSDGTARLISVAEFEALDRSSLTSLDLLLASAAKAP